MHFLLVQTRRPAVPKGFVRGFTLIELLVVIAIIGILSATVLASLTVARYKGADSAVRSNLHTIQVQAEVYASNNNNTYGLTFSSQPSAQPTPLNFGSQTNFFATDPTINGALKAAAAQGGNAYWGVGINATSYAVEVSLKSNSNWLCLDNTGQYCEATGGSLGGGPLLVAACPATGLAITACR